MDALDMLAADLSERVRCVYIDPPYNNRERYTHYSDVETHDKWLAGLEVVLIRLRGLLRQDGSIWISIDDNGVHYLKVLADQILGRENFVTTVVWEHRRSRENRKVFSNNHEYLLVYARDAKRFNATRNPVPATPAILKRYANPDRDPRGPWQSVSANVQAGHGTRSQFYVLTAPNGRLHRPPKGRCWVYTRARMEQAIAAGDVWFGRDGKGVPRLKKFLHNAPVGITPETLWTADLAGTTRSAKHHVLKLLPNEAVFETPKPEELIARVLTIATDPGDLVLDAYLGSGTTAAVAHKMARQWVGIERGDHAISHCVARLRKVVDGCDEGGITSAVGWKGGGGFTVRRFSTTLKLAA